MTTTPRTVRRPWLGASLALGVALGAAMPAVQAAPAPPDVPYLIEDAGTWTIHDGGATTTLPSSIVDNSGKVVDGAGTFTVVGEVGAGYVVAERAIGGDFAEPPTSLELHLVGRDSSATTFYEKVSEDDAAALRLSDDGSQVFVSSQDEGTEDARVVGLDGRVRQLPGAWIGPRALDFPGPKRLLFTDHQVARSFQGERVGIRYLMRDKTVTIARGHWERVSVGDLEGDVFATEAKRKRRTLPVMTTFHRISKPRRTLWTGKFAAYELNPTSKRVLGLGQGPARATQVRRVSDGEIIGKLHPGIDYTSVTWEDTDHVLFRREGTFVRCEVTGPCATVTTD